MKKLKNISLSQFKLPSGRLRDYFKNSFVSLLWQTSISQSSLKSFSSFCSCLVSPYPGENWFWKFPESPAKPYTIFFPGEDEITRIIICLLNEDQQPGHLKGMKGRRGGSARVERRAGRRPGLSCCDETGYALHLSEPCSLLQISGSSEF